MTQFSDREEYATLRSGLHEMDIASYRVRLGRGRVLGEEESADGGEDETESEAAMCVSILMLSRRN